MVAQHVLGQIEREAVRIIEFECDFARQRVTAAFFDAREFGVDQFKAAIEGLAEARFFLSDHFGSLRGGRFDFGISGAHRLDHARMRHREERAMDSEVTAVTRGAPDDSPQHVFAIGVAGRDAVGDEEGHRACVVGNRAKRYVALVVLAVVRLAAELLRGLFNFVDDRLKQIDVVVAENLARLDALQRRRSSLQACARIDVFFRQRTEVPRRVAVELDENEVADLDEALAAVDVHEALLPRVIFFRSARRLAAVDADFRVGTAWPRLAHLPEIILVAEP